MVTKDGCVQRTAPIVQASRQAAREFQVASATPEAPLFVSSEQQAMALEYAARGDTQGLRQLSLAKHSESIRSAKDSHAGRTCLHLAAMGGHASACQWLLTEVDCDGEVLDTEGKTPLDYALEKKGDADSIISIFRELEKERQRTKH